MIAVLGGLADVERDLIRTRTAEGRNRAKRRGQHMGQWEAEFGQRPRQRTGTSSASHDDSQAPPLPRPGFAGTLPTPSRPPKNARRSRSIRGPRRNSIRRRSRLIRCRNRAGGNAAAMARSPSLGSARTGTVATTAHLPKEVRNRLKKLAVDLERTP